MARYFVLAGGLQEIPGFPELQTRPLRSAAPYRTAILGLDAEIRETGTCGAVTTLIELMRQLGCKLPGNEKPSAGAYCAICSVAQGAAVSQIGLQEPIAICEIPQAIVRSMAQATPAYALYSAVHRQGLGMLSSRECCVQQEPHFGLDQCYRRGLCMGP